MAVFRTPVCIASYTIVVTLNIVSFKLYSWTARDSATQDQVCLDPSTFDNGLEKQVYVGSFWSNAPGNLQT